MMRLHVLGGGDKVVDVGRKGRFCEVAFAFPEPGEVEPEHGKPLVGEGPADRPDGLQIFGAGKAVREESARRRLLAHRQVEASGERVATRILEGDVPKLHEATVD